MNQKLADCINRYPVLMNCAEAIQMAYERIREVYQDHGKLLICGNGGSAADADHISGELLKSFSIQRPIDDSWRERLGDDLADNLQGALPAIPLPVFSSLMTAFANDCDPLYVFAQLTWGLGRPGDPLLCISTSGNSKNVIKAAQVAQAKGLHCIGLTGASGGKLKELTDICICVPETEVFKIQELHLPIYHTLCMMLEDTFFKNEITVPENTGN